MRRRLVEPPGDMARYGEIWADMGRYGQIYGAMRRLVEPLGDAHRSRVSPPPRLLGSGGAISSGASGGRVARVHVEQHALVRVRVRVSRLGLG